MNCLLKVSLLCSAMVLMATAAPTLPHHHHHDPHHHHAPIHFEPSPYGYKYAVEDGFGNTQERAEEGDGAGAVKGSYSVQDANGVYRVVEYLADDLGFRALVKTNEPGTANQNPADVLVVAEDVPPHVADYTAHHQAHLQAHHAHHHVPVPHLHHAHHHHAHHDHPPFPAPPPKFAAAASYAPKPYVKPAPAKYRPPVYVQPPKPDAIHLLEAPQMNRPQHVKAPRNAPSRPYKRPYAPQGPHFPRH